LPDPDLEEQYRVLIEHYQAMLELYGEDIGVRVARKHLGWYTKGLTGSAEFRNHINRLESGREVLDNLAQFYAPWRRAAPFPCLYAR
jgi:tRNA-dihydrouridine synthase B